MLGIRDTKIDENNPHSVQERIKMIQDMFGDSVNCIVVPDIDGLYYGRNVGYDVCELEPPEEIGEISASKIRGKKD